MMTLINSLPWFFWVLWGVFGIPYILIWVVKSTKNDPILWRIGWGLMGAVLSVVVIIDNLIKGTGAYIEYLPMVSRISIPLVVLTCSLISIGGYQKAMRPDFDPEKRRMLYLYMCALAVTVICVGLVFAGVYIHRYLSGR